MEILRSLLFTPGHREAMVAKAPALTADAVILDFEDGVPPANKIDARRVVSEALRRPRAGGGPAYLVRVNSAASGLQRDDLRAVVGPGLVAIVLPKVEDRSEISNAAHLIGDLERESGLEPGVVKLIGAIESARGLHRCAEIAEADARMIALFFGAEDFAFDLGLPVSRSGPGRELLYARSAVVNAGAMARLQVVDQVWTDFHDLAGLQADAVAGRDMGFTGKCLIHPVQIEIVNKVFAPSPQEVALAQRVVAAYEEALAAGVGAVMLGGQLVELPVVLRAQRTLRVHASVSAGR
ncbi:MAG: HpcH/HpaI aldolase/citrate lyase family protein [Solirubrobacterales bacterium]